MTDELKSVRLQMVIAPSQVAEIDEWRKAQDDLPSRSEAVRRLVNQGLMWSRKWHGLKNDEADTILGLLETLKSKHG